MSLFVDLTLNGITYGVIYAAVALGLVLIWRATRILNFAQGALATLTTYIAVSLLDRSVNYWLAFVAALVAGLVVGAVTERVFIRPLYGKPELNPVVVSIGLLILVESLVGAIWGADDRGFTPAFSQNGIEVGNTHLDFSRFDIFVVVSVLVLMLAMLVLFRWTSLGLKMRAGAFAPEVARLLGVRVGRILTVGWALATLAGALAGLLVAPLVVPLPEHDGPDPRVRTRGRRARRPRQPGRGARRRDRHRAGHLLCRRLPRLQHGDRRRGRAAHRRAVDPARGDLLATEGEAGVSVPGSPA